MAPEQPRGGELSELVANHVLRDVHGNELVTVVHRDRMPDEIRRNGTRPRPGLDDRSLISGIHSVDLGKQLSVEVRTLPNTTRHRIDLRSTWRDIQPLGLVSSLRRLAPFAPADDVLVGLFLSIPRLLALTFAPRGYRRSAT